MKSYTPECAKIEKFAATLVPVKSYLVCVQDFATKDYTLQLAGKSITIPPYGPKTQTATFAPFNIVTSSPGKS